MYSRANIEKVFNEDRSTYERHKDEVWFPKSFTKEVNEATFKIKGTDKESEIDRDRDRDGDAWGLLPAKLIFFNIFFTPDIQNDRTYLTDKGSVFNFTETYFNIKKGGAPGHEELFKKVIAGIRGTVLFGDTETDGRKFRKMARVIDAKLSYFLFLEALCGFFTAYKKGMADF